MYIYLFWEIAGNSGKYWKILGNADLVYKIQGNNDKKNLFVYILL